MIVETIQIKKHTIVDITLFYAGVLGGGPLGGWVAEKTAANGVSEDFGAREGLLPPWKNIIKPCENVCDNGVLGVQ